MANFLTMDAQSWMGSFLKTEFYLPCFYHSTECNMYCIDCNGNSLCATCLRRDRHHDHHRILQVRKASYKAAIDVNDIRGFIDIRGIKIFRINDKSVLFLRSRVDKQHRVPSTCTLCIICDWPLKTDDLYCSIDCKLTSKPVQVRLQKSSSHLIPELNLHQKHPIDRKGKESPFSSNGDAQKGTNYRKRRRKSAFPRRAPFF